MKRKYKRIPALSIIILIFLIVPLFITNITISKQKKCLAQELAILYEQTNNNRRDIPTFILNYWPTENQNITTVCYILTANTLSSRRGVGVTLRTIDIAEYEILSETDKVLEPFHNRIYLYIDGNLVSNTFRSVIDNITEVSVIKDDTEFFTGVSSGYEIIWFPIILPDKHTAKIEIHTKLGVIFEFSWQFILNAY